MAKQVDNVSSAKVVGVSKKRTRRKSASMLQIVEFVTAHAYVDGLEIEDCPDDRAYTFWKACREDDKFRNDFLQKTAIKLMPSRIEEEIEKNLGDYDGKVVVETIDRLLAMREESEVEADG